MNFVLTALLVATAGNTIMVLINFFLTIEIREGVKTLTTAITREDVQTLVDRQEQLLLIVRRLAATDAGNLAEITRLRNLAKETEWLNDPVLDTKLDTLNKEPLPDAGSGSGDSGPVENTDGSGSTVDSGSASTVAAPPTES